MENDPAPWQGAPVSAEATQRRLWFIAAPALAVFLASALVFASTLHFDFLSWDDRQYVVRNTWVHGLSWKNVRLIFSEPYFNNYLPLHLLSYQLDYSLWGLTPRGYHLHSIVLHAVNSLLAYLVLRLLCGNRGVAFLSALFFAVHPVHVESVAWISSRKDLLSMTFLLLSLGAYLRSRTSQGPRKTAYALSVLFFLLAALSKAVVVLYPLFLVILDLSERPPASGEQQAPWWRLLSGKIPYFLVSIPLAYVNNAVQVRDSKTYSSDLGQYLLTKGFAVWNYFLVLTGARRGRPLHDLPQLGANQPATYFSIVALVLSAVAAYVLVRRGRRSPLLAAGWLALLLAPALAFPTAYFMAERYLYAPSLGFCWLIATALVTAASLLPKERWRGPAVVLFSFLVGGLFTFRTLQYLPVWQNSESLWSEAVTVSNEPVALEGLATVRMHQGRFAEAEGLLLRIEQPSVSTCQSFGVLFEKAGRYQEALRKYDQAIALFKQQPGNPMQLWVLHFNRGVVFWRMKDYPNAARAYEEALRLNPLDDETAKWVRLSRQKLSGAL